ncbi:MAG: hypothetical protein KGY49_07575 [Wenzhouxiangellaceae bacterium]|nr:hypothetical protein [Wenzhouxiangellaceae bacterium]
MPGRLLAFLFLGLAPGNEIRLQSVAEAAHVQSCVTEEYRKYRGHLERLDASRNTGADGDENEQRIEGILERPSELHPGDNTGKAECQRKAVLDDKHDCGDHTRKNQRGFVERMVVDAGAVNAFVDPCNGQDQQPGSNQSDDELTRITEPIEILAGPQHGADDLAVGPLSSELRGIDADFAGRGKIPDAADGQQIGKRRKNRDYHEQQQTKRQMVGQHLSKQLETVAPNAVLISGDRLSGFGTGSSRGFVQVFFLEPERCRAKRQGCR